MGLLDGRCFAHFNRYDKRAIILHGLMVSVDKTIAAPDAAQGPSRGFRGIHQGED